MWTITRPPLAMRRLPSRVRARAVRIANELLKEGRSKAEAVRVAIGRAKKPVARARKTRNVKLGKPPRRRGRRAPQRGRPMRVYSAASKIGRGQR